MYHTEFPPKVPYAWCATLEAIRQAGGTGKYREYADAALRGFGVKVTPQGGIAYYYRWTHPNGKHGRKTVGHYPGVAPSAARDLAKKIAATLDHKRKATR